MEIGGGQDQGFGGGNAESGQGRGEEQQPGGDQAGESASMGTPDPAEKDQPAEGGVEEATDGAGRS